MIRPGSAVGGVRRGLTALALLVLAALLPARAAEAQDSIELTMMYHGNVSGKIAPCG